METEVTVPVIQEAPAESPTEEPSEPWRIIKQVIFEHEPTYAAFMSESFGVTNCGQHNYQPSTTIDGGKSWIQFDFVNEVCPNAFDIVDVQSIWLCNSYSVFFSQDGGQSSEYRKLPAGERCKLLSFVDDEIGWGASGQSVAATKDGANSWDKLALPEEASDIAAILLRTSEKGYVLDFDRRLFSTNDGGNTWSAVTLEIEDSDLALMNVGYPSAAIRFLDDQHGIVILNLAGGGKGELRALNTADGGQTWEHYTLPLELGGVYLSQDGQYLTVTEMGGDRNVTILKNQTAVDS